jgi:predicted nucleic acid-binding protein
MAVVVSDTSPIRALVHLELIEALAPLFGEVFVPPAVVAELSHPPGSFRSIDVGVYPYLIVRSASDVRRVEELCQELDRGEAEAVALAVCFARKTTGYVPRSGHS